MKMNVRLLRRVAKHIAAEPRRFQMGDWIIKKSEEGERFREFSHKGGATLHNFAPCGTAACIGGWTQIISKRKNSTAALAIDEYQSLRLFNVSEWPEQFETPYLLAKTPAKRVRIAVARIEHFIKTKGQE
jgi:hypothetical protein